MREELIPRVVERLSALADATRVRLLLRLREAPAGVSALAEAVGASQASISKHLSVLRRVGLVDAERRGTLMLHRIRDETIFDLCRMVCDGVVEHARREHDAVRPALLDAQRHAARRRSVRAGER